MGISPQGPEPLSSEVLKFQKKFRFVVMTRMSKQARRRAMCPKKRKPKYAIKHPSPAPRIAYKARENVVESNGLVFIPRIG